MPGVCELEQEHSVQNSNSCERVLLCQPVMLIDIPVYMLAIEVKNYLCAANSVHVLGFPWIANPNIIGGQRRIVVPFHHFCGQQALLRLVLVLLGISKSLHS